MPLLVQVQQFSAVAAMSIFVLLQSCLLLSVTVVFSSVSSASPLGPHPFAELLAKRVPGFTGADPLIVDLGYSAYKGTYNTSTHINSWKGIRFAAPPTGKLRWQAPQPPPLNRSSVIVASQYGSQCPQSPNGNPDFLINAQWDGSNEDCLFLNVFAPQNASGLPVMLWIHGYVVSSPPSSQESLPN